MYSSNVLMEKMANAILYNNSRELCSKVDKLKGMNSIVTNGW